MRALLFAFAPRELRLAAGRPVVLRLTIFASGRTAPARL